MPNYHLSPQANARFLALGRLTTENAEAFDRLARRFDGKVLIPYFQSEDATLDRIYKRGNACHALVAEWLRLCGTRATEQAISSWLYDIQDDEARTDRIGRFMRAQYLVMANEQHRWLQARDMANQPFSNDMGRADLRAAFASLRADPRHASVQSGRILAPERFDALADNEKNDLQWSFGKFARLRQLESSMFQASYGAGTTLIRDFGTTAVAARSAVISQFIKSAASEWGAGTAVLIHLMGNGGSGHTLGLLYKSDILYFFDPNRGVFCWKGQNKQTKLQGFKGFFSQMADLMGYNAYSVIALNSYTAA
ncbi:hypothetical protein [Hyalangium versicolor]|uniref:hypothetical protein n=1 Tax=Hyalangium versicolor TaxID=2861190 RepID=UPI001CCDD783|nr:hypothetical protein [Hyalangium versicolor]